MKRFLAAGLFLAVLGLSGVKADGVWRAGTIESFHWSVEDNDWLQSLGSPTKLTYDSNGLVKTVISVDRKQVYEYNENLLPTAIYSYGLDEESGIWNETQVQTYEYDDVVRSWVVRTEVKADWGSYGSGVRVERDKAGNVVKLVNYGFADSDTRVYDTTEITYGADGTAESMTVTGNDGKVRLRMTDVEWENTDGQITELTYQAYNGKLYFGDNRIKRAKIEAVNPADSGFLNVKYEDENYLSTLTADGERVKEIGYRKIDEYGSFEMKLFQVEFDIESGHNVITGSSDNFQRFIFDSCDLVIEDTKEQVIRNSDGEEEKIIDQTLGAVEYDPEYGYPVEYVLTANTGNPAESVNVAKALYSDYTLCGDAEVNAIDCEEGEAEYYTIDGLRVSRPAKGLYIRRIGSHTSKILL